MLRNIDYKGVYKSDQDNILKDFYFPMLEVATHYDRAVGFFSASTICYAAQALSVFVKNGGEIRLILGAFTDAEDIEAVKSGLRERRRISDKISGDFIREISSVSDALFQNRFDTLSWLVLHGRLKIKIALRERGMFHDKIGIVSDSSGDKVVFSGSANESKHALLPTHNYESINVFRTWIPEHAEFYGPHVDSFNRLWRGDSSGTAIIDLPDAIQDNLIRVAKSLEYEPDPIIEAEVASRIRAQGKYFENTNIDSPRLPIELNGRPFRLLAHQHDALQSWKSRGDFHGVFELATGAGKTVTAIRAIVSVSELLKRHDANCVCIVAVPYQNLADQWVETLKLFGISPIRCYSSYLQWKGKLENLAHKSSMGEPVFGCVVVVNKTLLDARFQKCLRKMQGDGLLWIGDECHHHTTRAFEKALPTQAKFRIGLSATPEHYMDEERNTKLGEYYGDIIYRYSLEQAISDKVLTPYEYFPTLVELTENESEEFIDLSERIGLVFAKQSRESERTSPELNILLGRRSRLIGSAQNKLKVLENILKEKAPSTHTLFYCGEGTAELDTEGRSYQGNNNQTLRQIELVSILLDKYSWNVSRFTSTESRREREKILQNFGVGIIDALVAIRCLDEGIDIPACDTAYILASARDPRQFVQRRGRILRRSPGKELARIHDFIVVLPSGRDTDSEYGERLIKWELARVAEFSVLANNRHESYKALSPILKRYDLEHLI